MTQREAINILATAFRTLPKRDRNRLEYHRQKGTGICCGVYFKWFQRGKSG